MFGSIWDTITQCFKPTLADPDPVEWMREWGEVWGPVLNQLKAKLGGRHVEPGHLDLIYQLPDDTIEEKRTTFKVLIDTLQKEPTLFCWVTFPSNNSILWELMSNREFEEDTEELILKLQLLILPDKPSLFKVYGIPEGHHRDYLSHEQSQNCGAEQCLLLHELISSYATGQDNLPGVMVLSKDAEYPQRKYMIDQWHDMYSRRAITCQHSEIQFDPSDRDTYIFTIKKIQEMNIYHIDLEKYPHNFTNAGTQTDDMLQDTMGLAGEESNIHG